MTIHRLLLAASLIAVPASVAASEISVGATDARRCFEAAESPRTPRGDDMERCDLALSQPLSRSDQVATLNNRGVMHLRRGNVDLALADFDRAMELDPSQAESYLNRGSVAVRRANMDEAVQYFTAALERRTRRPHLAYYGRAMAFEEMGNVRAAYSNYVQASEAAPNWAPPREDLRRFRVARQ